MSTDRETLYRGLSRAAWGYLFLHFDFNLGTVSVTPRFAGYLMLLSAIGYLAGERRDLALLRPLGWLLAAWSGVGWLLSWGGESAGGHIPFLDLIVAAAGLYFHFQFLTDMAALAERYQPEGDDLDARLLRRRTVYVVLDTFIDLVMNLPGSLSGEWRMYAAMGAGFLGLIAAVWIMLGLFELRRCFREEEPEWSEPDV